MQLKNKFRLNTIPTICKLATTLGTPWDKLVNRFPREAMLAQTQILFDQPFPMDEQTDKPLDILFMPYIGCFLGNNMIQATLGKVLQARGHRVRFLVADIDLPICETTDISSHDQRGDICENNAAHLLKFMVATGFDIVRVSDLVDPAIASVDCDPEQAERWSAYVGAMLLRYFKVGLLSEDHPRFADFQQRARNAAVISQRVGEAVVKLAPDRVIMSHGTYTTRGPAREVINEAGVPLLTVSRGKIAQTQKFNWTTAGDWWSVDEEWERVCATRLTESEDKTISEYLDSRRNHTKDVMVYNFSDEEDREKTLDKLGIESGQTVYTLFTNVLWDAASAQRELVFSNPMDWVAETIRWFAEQPDKSLVVRIHPAEAVIGTQQPMMELIRSTVKNIPSNVKLLEPDAPFNSWSLLKVTDVGLVHTSTVGLELALEGTPCVCVAKTHYRDKGFTVDTNSKDEYFDVLNNGPKDFNQSETQALAKRYSFLLFMRYQLSLPFYLPESHISIRGFKSVNWDTISKSHEIRLIVQGIEEQQESILLPIESPQTTSRTAS